MHLLPTPTVWALKPPSWALHLLGLSLANICVCTPRYAGMNTYRYILCLYANVGLSRVGSCTLNHICTFDLYGPVRHAFDAGSICYLGKWEGVGPWKSQVFWALNGTHLSARCHFTGPKNLSGGKSIFSVIIVQKQFLTGFSERQLFSHVYAIVLGVCL